MQALKVFFYSAVAASPLIIWQATAEEIGANQTEKIIEPVNLPHKLLESSIFFQCQDGKCTEDYREVLSNVSEEEVKKRLQQENTLSKNVRERQSERDSVKFATARTLSLAAEKLAAGNPKDLLDVVIYLEEQPFDFKRLRALRKTEKKSDYSAVIDERRRQLSDTQEKASRQTEKHGGKVKGRFFLNNMISASVPADQLHNLLNDPSVEGIELDAKTTNNADGVERRNAMGIPAGGISGLDGGQGSTNSVGPEVLFGVIESNNAVNTSHFSFFDWSGGPNNIIDTDTCTSGSCSGSSTTTSNTHGTNVTSVLIGSLEQGQNSNVTDTTERRRRSGIAIESFVHYYNDGGSLAAVAQAIDSAVADGVDVINMSLSPTSDYCDNHTLSGVRAAARSATDAGLLLVVSAGNDADDLPAGTCSVSSIGAIPDTLTVGATNDVTNLTSMDTVGLADYSGRGTVTVTLDGGRSVSTRMVDLIVTGDVDLIAGSGTSGTASNTGTSFAAPQVAGTAGLLKDWIDTRGSFGGMEDDPYALRTLLSVMGDGSANTGGGGSGNVVSLSDHSGFGHLRFIDLDAEIGSGGWGLQRRFVTEGQVIDWSVWDSAPESSAVNGWKFVALWDWNLYGESPDIKFELIDKCPSGGGEVVVRTASRHPLKARMRMSSSEMSSNFHGRCLWMRATVEHASGTVPLYTADYFYTNARSNHDMP